jgi:hypothetical protein
MPDDLQILGPDSDDEQSEVEPLPTSLTGDPMQRGNRSKTIDFVVLHKVLCGWKSHFPLVGVSTRTPAQTEDPSYGHFPVA